MANNNEAGLFAIPDFWKPSTWQTVESTALDTKQNQDGLFSLQIGGREAVTFFLGRDDPPETHDTEDVFFKTPASLRQLQVDKPQDADREAESKPESFSTETADLDDDFWLYPDDNRVLPAPEFKTWAAFEQADIPHSTPLLATEQGPDLLDALICAEDNPLGLNSAHNGADVLDPRGHYACLLALALGRNSVLFSWDDSKRSFISRLESARISGCTGDLLRSVEKGCVECGNNMRFLRAFVDHTYVMTASTTPLRVALARSVDSLFLTVQRELGLRGQKARSLLELQASIRPVSSLVKFIRGLVTKLSRARSDDEQLLATLYEEAQSMEHSTNLIRNVTQQILQTVAEPWLAFVSAWIGLDPKSKSTLWAGEYHSKSFVRIGDRVWIDDMGTELAESDYFLDEDKMPAFIPDEMARALFEAGRNLRFLWSNHPEHPFSNPATFTQACPPLLQWQFSWESIYAVEHTALAYEQALGQITARLQRQQESGSAPLPSLHREPLRAPLLGGLELGWRLPSLELQYFGRDNDQIAKDIQTSIAKLNDPVPCAAENGLTAILRRQLFDNSSDERSDFPPHWSLLPLLSFGPVISAQARLVNRECSRLLFAAHNIREHLRLQREFQLLNNGVFCTRLSHALFDPDLGGAELKGGIEPSSSGLGLRLMDRESWPPASSELRLALMGVLADSYYYQGRESHAQSTGLHDVPVPVPSEHELPGGMSFAVRDLSQEEMTKCMDPDSLEALDFLRLSYKPPSALMSVITPAVLGNYDRIFKLLLRVLRMYYVVNQLVRDSSPRTSGSRGLRHDGGVAARFRMEMRHFVANIMTYFLDVGVGIPWQRFEGWLDGVQASLCEATGPSERAASPDMLRERHEQALDEIMSALLLRKRQQPLFQLLQDIFAVILEFAKSSRVSRAKPEQEHLSGRDQEKTTEELYASFRKKVGVFLTVCRGLSEKEADSVARRDRQQHQQPHVLDTSARAAGETNTSIGASPVSRLILMLDYNGTYSSGR